MNSFPSRTLAAPRVLDRPRLPFWVVWALVVAILASLPLAYLVFHGLSADAATWSRIARGRLLELSANSIALALAVGTGAATLGLACAWAVTRFDFPGRRIWTWLLVLPLAIPPYLTAFAYRELVGRAWTLRFAVAAGVLTLATYPYVYLLARAALLRLHGGFEEVAALSCARKATIPFTVVLPMLRPAVAAGVSLAVLYTLADFGAVSILDYPTFTRAIYVELTTEAALRPGAREAFSGASVLALAVVPLVLAALVAERRFRRQARYFQTEGAPRPARPTRLGIPGALLVTAGLGSIATAAFGFVLWRLVRATLPALEAGAAAGVGRELANTLFLSAAAATLTVVAAFGVTYAAARTREAWLSRAARGAAYAGYVLPGPLVAAAILALVHSEPIVHVKGLVYGTSVILVLAYFVRFLPQALQSCEAGLDQIAPSIEEAAQAAGASPARALARVVVPLLRPSLVTGWLLVFLAAARELPATLLLRPMGRDTLAVRIWQETSDEFVTLASPAAIVLVVICVPLAILALSRDLGAFDRSKAAATLSSAA